MQANQVSETEKNKNPENLLLWRRESYRLEAESIRDALLAVSGKLDTTMYGKGTLDFNNARCSVYFTVKRSKPPPFLLLFDAPDTMLSVGSCEENTVAPQALAMINSPFVCSLATQFSQRVHPDEKSKIEDAVYQAYLLALSRQATSEKLTAMTAFIQSQVEARNGNPAAVQLAVRNFCHLLLCANEFIYID